MSIKVIRNFHIFCNISKRFRSFNNLHLVDQFSYLTRYELNKKFRYKVSNRQFTFIQAEFNIQQYPMMLFTDHLFRIISNGHLIIVSDVFLIYSINIKPFNFVTSFRKVTTSFEIFLLSTKFSILT